MKTMMRLSAILVTIGCLASPVGAQDKTSVQQGMGQQAYSVSIPATLSPGQRGTVHVEGTWAEDYVLEVTADESVTLMNDIDQGTKKLNVNFAGIKRMGDGETAISDDAEIQVDEAANALFGTWSGAFSYQVSLTEVSDIVQTSETLNTTETSTAQISSSQTTETTGKQQPTQSAEDTSDRNQPQDSEEETDDGVTEFTVTAENLAAVGYAGTEEEFLTIPDTFVGDGENGTVAGTSYRVTAISEDAFQGCTQLQSVLIPASVETVGENCFAECTNLTSIIMYFKPTGSVAGAPWGAEGAAIKLCGMNINIK